jgi:hypothetical protein
MRKVIGFLFPWRNTFRGLELEKRWWHRLAVVVFFVALVPALVFAWVIGDDAYTPVNRFDSNIHHWGQFTNDGILFDIDSMQPLDNNAPAVPPPPPPGYSANDVVPTSNQPAPKGDIFDQVAGKQPTSPPKSPPIAQKTIEMPNGKTVTYPGATPDETIQAEWNHRLTIANGKATVFGFGWAALATLIFSYLLQAAYRALVYVIYGAKARATPDNPAEG